MKKPPPCIALLTDFGNADVYGGLLKAVIYSVCPAAAIIDLCHGIEPQNVLHGAAVLESSYEYFPEGTVFVCVVDPGVGTPRKILAVKSRDYYFIGPDNGLLAPVIKRERGAKVRLLENRKFFRPGPFSSTFHGRDIMAPVAAHLAKSGGVRFSQLGPLAKNFHRLEIPRPVKMRRFIEGLVLYFDHYGNAVTNIRKEDMLEDFWKGRQVQVKRKNIGFIRSHYAGDKNKPLALFNSFSRLEIAWPAGSAKDRMGLAIGDKVRIRSGNEPEI